MGMDSFRAHLAKGAVLLYLVLAGVNVLLQAQQPTGEIRLEVKDPSGAAVIASGTLRNLAGGGVRTFQTDTQGMYRFSDLAYGRYRLEVSKTGFASQSLPIDVQSGTPILRTVIMALGVQSSRVE